MAGYNLYRSATVGGPYTRVNGSLIPGTTYGDSGLTNGTAYYYAVRAVDTSANESTYSNEVSATPLASLGAAVSFDGTDDYVTFGTASGLGVTNFTLETWFYWTGGGVSTTTIPGLMSVIPLVSKGRLEGGGDNRRMNYFLGIDAWTKTLAASFQDMATGRGMAAAGTKPITTNTWHHGAAAYDSVTGVWKLYLDGVLDLTLAIGRDTLPRADSIQHAGLGTAMTSAGTPAGYFQGSLDEVRIWNVARTQSEIIATINQELTSGAGLIGRWGMNEGAGTTIASSVGAFNGALTNGPVWGPGSPFNRMDPVTPPAAPSNLRVAPTSSDQMYLLWQDNSTDEGNFKIERWINGGSTFAPAGTVGADVVTFNDTGLAASTRYCYRVYAENSGGPSTYSTTTCATTAATPGYGLDFGSGTAYVTFGHPAVLDLSQFTIETWFKRTGAGTPSSTGSHGIPAAIPLVTHGESGAEGSGVDANWILAIDATNDVLAADFEDADTGRSHPVYGTTPITSNVWHHAAATYDGSTWRLYLDGNLEVTLAVDLAPRSGTTQPASLGTLLSTSGTPNGHFEGVLDEVRIWNLRARRRKSGMRSTMR